MADQPSSMIELKDIVVKFGDFEALHNINVDVKQGEFLPSWAPPAAAKPPRCARSPALSSP